jgi:hypothetical protein
LLRGRSSEDICGHLDQAKIVIADPSPSSTCRTITLLFKQIGVIHVMTAPSAAPRRTIMTTFTIDEQNNITAFGSAEEAAAATATPFDSFSSQKELAALVCQTVGADCTVA